MSGEHECHSLAWHDFCYAAETWRVVKRADDLQSLELALGLALLLQPPPTSLCPSLQTSRVTGSEVKWSEGE